MLEQESAAVSALPADDSYWRGKTVLVAEDDDIWRTVLTAILANNGFKVIPANDGKEALAEYRKPDSGIDLILSDIMMPDVDGVELAHINFDERYLPFSSAPA